ncbi:MAG: arsenate reductase (glutaredoxin) [Alphaproteobacteria bacterium HGW-Alphaproteobacteria-12]|nr:MAG: arsenate reductase (glutaredoxin) [Alphaproteobacteria bacterium HGW-Alphaproteobacteria-12]
MPGPTIYHNPRCSKSRAALALLEERGLEPVIVDYLKTPPSVAELQTILTKLKMRPRDLMRKGEAVYKSLGLADESLSDEKLIRAMADNPVLIERPIVLSGAKARIGRPPESVLEIL